MAIITKFGGNNLDFKADILAKLESDAVACIRTCRHAIDCDIVVGDDLLIARMTLATAYMKINAYQYALIELKSVLADYPNHPDAIFLIVSVLRKLPNSSHTAPIEYFQALYGAMGACEKVDEVFMAACQDLKDIELAFDDDDNELFVVPDEDIVNRLIATTHDLIVEKKYSYALELLESAEKKYTDSLVANERIAFCLQMVGDHKRAMKECESNMKKYNNSYFSVLIMLEIIADHELKYDTKSLLKYLMDSTVDTEEMLHEVLVVLERAGWDKQVRAKLELATHLSDSPLWRTAEAICDYKDGNNDLAIKKLKTVHALYGTVSLGNEYIKVIENEYELTISGIGELPEQQLYDVIENVSMSKETYTNKEFNKFFDDDELMSDLYFVAFEGETNILRVMMETIDSKNIRLHWNTFREILLDEDNFVEEVRQIIMQYVLLKMPGVDVVYSVNDVVKKADFNVAEDQIVQNKALFAAYAMAYSHACYNSRNFAQSLAESYRNVAKLIGDSKKFTSVVTLAALISLGAYIYFSDDNISLVLEMFGATKATFNKYYTQLNKDKSIYSDSVADQRFMSQLNDIMKSFGKMENLDESGEDGDGLFDYDDDNKDK